MEQRAAQLGRVPGCRSLLAQAKRGCLRGVVTKTTLGPIPSQAQTTAQMGTGAPWEVGPTQASWHGCDHHPRTLRALPQPWVVLGERRPSPACPLVQLEADTSAESQLHSQPCSCCQNISGAGQSLEAAGPMRCRLSWCHPRARPGMGTSVPLLGPFGATQH